MNRTLFHSIRNPNATRFSSAWMVYFPSYSSLDGHHLWTTSWIICQKHLSSDFLGFFMDAPTEFRAQMPQHSCCAQLLRWLKLWWKASFIGSWKDLWSRWKISKKNRLTKNKKWTTKIIVQRIISMIYIRDDLNENRWLNKYIQTECTKCPTTNYTDEDSPNIAAAFLLEERWTCFGAF